MTDMATACDSKGAVLEVGDTVMRVAKLLGQAARRGEEIMSKPRERSIIYRDWEIRALLDGRKVRTTVPLVRLNGIGPVTEFGPSDTPGYDWTFRDRMMRWHDLRADALLARCPFGVPGGRLIGKERHYISNVDRGNPKVCIEYGDSSYILTDKHPLPTLNEQGEYDEGVKVPGYLCRWRPPQHMPRWASRLDLGITSVAVGRVQGVGLEHLEAEGIDLEGEHAELFFSAEHAQIAGLSCGCRYAEIYPFACLWNRRYPKYPYAENPWVWHIGHEVSKPGEGVGG